MSDFQGSNRQSQIETTALIEATRNTVALQAGLSGMMAKLEAIREMFSDHKSNTAMQFTRIDSRMDTIAQDQRAIDTKVDKWQTEAIRRIEEAIALGESTKKAVQALDPPVARWREMEVKLKTGRWLFALIGGASAWIVIHFMPIIQMVLQGSH